MPAPPFFGDCLKKSFFSQKSNRVHEISKKCARILSGSTASLSEIGQSTKRRIPAKIGAELSKESLGGNFFAAQEADAAQAPMPRIIVPEMFGQTHAAMATTALYSCTTYSPYQGKKGNLCCAQAKITSATHIPQSYRRSSSAVLVRMTIVTFNSNVHLVQMTLEVIDICI